MTKRPYDQKTPQPYLTGMPEFYDDRSESFDDVLQDSLRLQELGKFADELQAQLKAKTSDVLGETLLSIFVSENREQFNKYLDDRGLNMARKNDENADSRNKKGDRIRTTNSARDVLDRWYSRFAEQKRELNYIVDEDDLAKAKAAMYNDAIATLLDIGYEMTNIMRTARKR